MRVTLYLQLRSFKAERKSCVKNSVQTLRSALFTNSRKNAHSWYHSIKYLIIYFVLIIKFSKLRNQYYIIKTSVWSAKNAVYLKLFIFCQISYINKETCNFSWVLNIKKTLLLYYSVNCLVLSELRKLPAYKLE